MEGSQNKSKGCVLPLSDATGRQTLSAPPARCDPIPREWNGHTVPFPRESTVLDFFRLRVQAQPGAVAIDDGQKLMSYQELDLHSNRVANELRRRGLELEESVAVFLPASCEFLAAIIGVLKAGGAYFPVATDIPVKRLEYLLGDSRSRLVLSNAAGGKHFSGWSGTVLDIARIIEPSKAEMDQYPDIPSHPKRRAYITYTSGSTGNPKGVEIEHRALTSFVCSCHRRFDITTKDRASMLAYVSFDASVGDIWPVLCAGGVLVIPPRGILLKPDGLVEWLAAAKVTLTFVSTGLLEIIMTRPWPEQMSLRFLMTGGDRLRVRPPAGLSFAIINGYGPTENTVFSTWSVVLPEDGTRQPPPIGRPLDNTVAYVLDEQMHQVPVGVAGELYVGGEQIARGYLGRPELTAERFLPDPFAGKPGARMYRTGDWAQWRPDGELNFIGRKDGQIKIRGRRVELGEIEAAISTCRSVKQVCCVPWLDEGMPAAVIAHIVSENHEVEFQNELRAHLQDRLPDYMVPARFVLCGSLPLTAQGKLDRAALIALQSAKPPVNNGQAPVTVTGDSLEKALSNFWHSLLPSAKDSPPDATFSYLGGDSLLAIKLMIGVEEITGQKLELSTFLLDPTFAGLCKAVKTRLARADFEPVLTLRKKGNRPPLFCLYGFTGDVECYFDLVEAMGADQPIHGIRSPALQDLSRLPETIEAAAAEVVRVIRKGQSHGAPALVGYSWAGLLAFEVARQLAAADGTSCFIAVIGTTAPVRPTNFTFRLVHFARFSPQWLWHWFLDRGNQGRRLTHWWKKVFGAGQNVAEVCPPAQDWASSPISRHLLSLREKYCPPPKSEVTVDFFLERDAYHPQAHPLQAWDTSHLKDGGWNLWTHKPNRIHWVVGDHTTVIKPPAVSDLAQSIRQAMDQHRPMPFERV